MSHQFVYLAGPSGQWKAAVIEELVRNKVAYKNLDIPVDQYGDVIASDIIAPLVFPPVSMMKKRATYILHVLDDDASDDMLEELVDDIKRYDNRVAVSCRIPIESSVNDAVRLRLGVGNHLISRDVNILVKKIIIEMKRARRWVKNICIC